VPTAERRLAPGGDDGDDDRRTTGVACLLGFRGECFSATTPATGNWHVS